MKAQQHNTFFCGVRSSCAPDASYIIFDGTLSNPIVGMSYIYQVLVHIIFFTRFYFPASGQAVVTGVVPSPPRFLPSIFVAHRGQIPLLVDFSSSIDNSRFRAFGKSICAQEKVPTNLYECALGGIRTHKNYLYQARGQPDTPPGRPAYINTRYQVHVFVQYMSAIMGLLIGFCPLQFVRRLGKKKIGG